MTASSDPIFLSPPHMSGHELMNVRQAFATNYVAPFGPMLERFEAALAECLDTPHVLAVSSGTAAMHLALHHLGIGPGDTVCASTLTFIGSVAPAVHLGASLRFIDSEETSWNMDPDLLAEDLAETAAQGILPKAVIPTDLYGQCVDLDRILEVCEPYGVPVICDAAESLGATYDGRPAGNGARAAVYSFNGNKIITTGGGGALASADADLIAHARKLATQAREQVLHYEHLEVGYNYRMSNLAAAVGLGQLQVLPERVTQRRQIFDRYRELLADLPGIRFAPEMPYGRSNRWLSVLLLDAVEAKATPTEVCDALAAEHIEARPIWKPMHLQPVFQGLPVRGGAVSEQLFRDGVCLPSGTAMTDEHIQRVTDCIRECCRQ